MYSPLAAARRILALADRRDRAELAGGLTDAERAAALADVAAEQAWYARTLRGWAPSRVERISPDDD